MWGSFYANQADTVATNTNTVANEMNTISILDKVKALGKYIVALATAHPVITSLIAIGASALIVAKVIDTINISEKEQLEINEKLQDSYNTTKSELEELNTTLSDTQTQLDTLYKIQENGKLSLVEENELDNLETQNALLQAQITLKERQLELDAQANNKGVEDWYSKGWQNPTEYKQAVSTYASTSGMSGTVYEYKDEETYYQESAKRIEELYAKKKNLANQFSKYNATQISKMSDEEIKSYQLSESEQKELIKLQNYFLKAGQDISDNTATYTPVTDEQYARLQYWNSLIEKSAMYTSDDAYWQNQEDTTVQNAFDSRLNNIAYSTAQSTGRSYESSMAELQSFIDANEIDTTEEYDSFLQLTDGIYDVTEAIQAYSNSLSNTSSASLDLFADDSATLTAITDYKSYLSDIVTANEKFANTGYLSDETILDLKEKFASIFDFQEFDMTGNVDEMLSDLRSTILDSVISTLEEVKAQFDEFSDEAIQIDSVIDALTRMSNIDIDFDTNRLDTLHNSLTSIKDAYNTVSEAVKEYSENGVLSVKTIESLLSLNDSYLTSLMDENGQIQLNKESYIELATARIQNIIAETAQQAIDLVGTIQSEEDALKYLEEQLYITTDAKWDDVEATIADAQANLQLASANGEDITARTEALEQIYASTKARIQLLQQAINSVKINPTDFFTDYKKSSSSDTKEEIDWAKQSLDILKDKVDDLQDAFDNAKGYDAQITALHNLNEGLEDLKDGYDSASVGYKKAYNANIKALGANGSSIKKKIESGEVFDVESFDKDTAKIINDAIDNYNNMRDNEKNSADVSLQISDNTYLEESKINQQKYEDKLATVNALLDDETLTTKQTNNLLRKKLKYQKLINAELIEQAKYNKDDEQVKQLEAENKQNEYDELTKEITNNQSKNQEKIDFWNEWLSDDTLSADVKNSLQQDLIGFTKKDYDYEIQLGLADIDETTLSSAVEKVQKELGIDGLFENKTDMIKFLTDNIDSAVGILNDTNIWTLWRKKANYTQASDHTLYEQESDNNSILLDTNNNKINDIQNAIDLNGRGTEKQFNNIIDLNKDNLEVWESQLESAQKYRQALIDAGETGTTEFQYWDNQCQTCENSINSINSTLKETEIALLNLPLDAIEDRITEIDALLTDTNKDISNTEKMINGAVAVIENNIDNLNKSKKIVQDELTALQKSNEEREKSLSLQQASYDLEKAKNQHTLRVFHEGKGWTWDVDTESVQDAQEKYDTAQYNMQAYLLQTQIDAYDKQIDSLNTIKDSWSNIVSSSQDALDISYALSQNIDFMSQVLSGDMGYMAEISSQYSKFYEYKDALEDEENSYSNIETLIGNIVDQYQNGIITSYDDANQAIQDVLTKYSPQVIKAYEKQGKTVKEIADMKLVESGIIKTSSEKDAENIASANEAIVDSTTALSENLVTPLTNIQNMIDSLKDSFSDLGIEIADVIQQTSTLSRISTPNLSGNDSTDDTVNMINKIQSVTTNILANVAKQLGSAISVGTSHSGMELGYIGSNSNDKDTFSMLCLDDLKDEEVPRILLKDEAVLTTEQQNRIVDNFKKVSMSSAITPIVNSATNEIPLSFTGDIVLNQVNDVNTFAKAIKQNLPNAMLQALYKNN